MSRTYLQDFRQLAVDDMSSNITRAISGAAALISGLVNHNEYLLEYAIDWVSTSSGTQAKGIAMRRALISVLASKQGELAPVLVFLY